MKIFLFALLTALVFTSCTLEQHINFNDDYSGRYEFTMDFSAMKGFMDAAAEEEGEAPQSLTEDMNVDSVVQALNSAPGLSNAVVSEENGKLVIGYDFANVETLNMVMQEMDMTSMLSSASGGKANMDADGAGKSSIERNGKKISFEMADLKDAGDADELQGMGSMMNFNVQMTFPDEIKKVKNKNAIVSGDGKTVTVSANFEELLSGAVSPSMTVKLK